MGIKAIEFVDAIAGPGHDDVVIAAGRLSKTPRLFAMLSAIDAVQVGALTRKGRW